ncbi:hypothetical protein BDR03DRAFT_964769 [Suillus americanus]|nr:hypothetical protein BDR03DRAFT_964769 [Suillus americanus]
MPRAILIEREMCIVTKAEPLFDLPHCLSSGSFEVNVTEHIHAASAALNSSRVYPTSPKPKCLNQSILFL